MSKYSSFKKLISRGVLLSLLSVIFIACGGESEEVAVSNTQETKNLDYNSAYDALAVKTYSCNYISEQTGIPSDILIKMRFGKVKTDILATQALNALLNSAENGIPFDSSVWKERTSQTKFIENSSQISPSLVQSEQLNRMEDLEVEYATSCALKYSELVDEFLDNKFDFFGSLWQAIRYSWYWVTSGFSDVKYGNLMAQELAEYIDSHSINTRMIKFLNRYKQTIEVEQQVIYGATAYVPDLTGEYNLTPFIAITADVRSQLAERGSFEAKDVATGAIIDYVIVAIITNLIGLFFKKVIFELEEERSAVHSVIGIFNPTSIFGNVLQTGAHILTDGFYGGKRYDIVRKQKRWLRIIKISAFVLGWFISFKYFVTPSMAADQTINEKIVMSFVNAYSNGENKVEDIFNPIITHTGELPFAENVEVVEESTPSISVEESKETEEPVAETAWGVINENVENSADTVSY